MWLGPLGGDAGVDQAVGAGAELVQLQEPIVEPGVGGDAAARGGIGIGQALPEQQPAVGVGIRLGSARGQAQGGGQRELEVGEQGQAFALGQGGSGAGDQVLVAVEGAVGGAAGPGVVPLIPEQQRQVVQALGVEGVALAQGRLVTARACS